MALLYRFTKLNDRHNTGIFTFIVTRSVTRDVHRDATTKDFYYGYHRWALSFTRANDKALSVFLILRNPSMFTECFADFTLTLLNREHFSRNESHQEKQAKFTVDKTTQGITKWLLLSEIQTRKFGDETGEFLLELSLGNILTNFKCDLPLTTGMGALKSGKFESASFNFGQFDWNVSLVVHNYSAGAAGAAANSTNAAANGGGLDVANTSSETINNNSQRIIYVFLNRLSGFDHPCRVQYRMIIGEGKQREDSALLDQISDAGGRIRGFQMQHSLPELIKPNGSVRIYCELHCCNSISEAKVPVIRNPSPSINCYDRNKQGWCIEADMDSEFVRLKLFFMDLHSVPRNHLRYISWIAYVVVRDPRSGLRESIAVANSPHSNYYIQDGIDMGAMMDTSLTVAKIKESPKVYLENENKLTVHVEWCDSIMLFNHIYHKYDDICRIHCHQMRREVTALSNENYSLEKQLVSYQKVTGPLRSTSKDNSSETGSIKGGHHLNQRSSSEVHLSEDHHQSPIRQQLQHHQSHQQHSSIERRQTDEGSSRNNSMLTLPSGSVTSGGSVSPPPSHSALGPTRSYHQSFQQQQQQTQHLIRSSMRSAPSDYSQSLSHSHHHPQQHHHQLPQIPVQSSQLGPSQSPLYYGMAPATPAVKNRFHYGSLPSSSMYDNVFEDDTIGEPQQQAIQQQQQQQPMLPGSRAVSRSVYRNRERSRSGYPPAGNRINQNASQFANNMVNSFNHSLPTLSQPPGPGPGQANMMSANGWTMGNGNGQMISGYYDQL